MRLANIAPHHAFSGPAVIDGDGCLMLTRSDPLITLASDCMDVAISNFHIIGPKCSRLKLSWLAIKWIWSKP